MRVALHSVLREGHEAAYDRDHAAIPDELAESFARLGIRNWTIWRSNRDLFHIVECDDFDGAMASLEADPANVRWQASIGAHVDHFVAANPGSPRLVLGEVWQLAYQAQH